nr:acetylornithine deacetylase [uncultured bacterium]
MEKNISPAPPKGEALKSLLLLLCLVAAAVVAVMRQSPPSPADAAAPPTEFSSARAMGHLRAIARRPHPVGSDAHAEVRSHILGVLSALGANPEVQQTTAVSRKANSPLRAGTVHNVIARLPGTNNTGAVIVAGHYDSVGTSSGASDDGAAVAAMLETARALKAGPPLRNDVILLFTDAEEVGLLGAEAFVREHPLAKGLGLILNFEARGSRGPSIMFESSPRNGRLIEEFGRAAERPIATSFSYEVYKRLPNDTDFTVLRETGAAGLNFAYIDDYTHYHTPLDDAERIDEGSLQHHGSNALSLTRHFGNLDMRGEAAGDAVYFDLLGLLLVRYPAALAVVLAALTAALFVGVAVLGFRRGLLSWGRLLGASAGFLLCPVAAAVGVSLAWWAVTLVHGNYRLMPLGVPYNGHLYLVGFAALTVCLTSALIAVFARKLGAANAALGALVWWLILTAVTAVLLPGGSYLFSWPLLFSLVGAGYYFYSRPEGALPAKLLAVLILTPMPAVVLLAPTIYHLGVALPLMMSGALMILVALAMGLLVLQVAAVARVSGWVLPAASLLVFLGLLIAGGLTSDFNERRPGLNSLFYGLDADSGRAIWGSADAAPDSWTARFLTGDSGPAAAEFLPLASNKFLGGPAPAAPLPAPEITLLGDQPDGGDRRLRLRVTSPRRASIISLYIDRGTEVRGLSVNGKRVEAPAAPARSPWAFRYFALPEEGIELEIGLKPGQPLRIKAVDQSYGLPELQGAPVGARPGSLIPAPYQFTDSTLVSRTFTF